MNFKISIAVTALLLFGACKKSEDGNAVKQLLSKVRVDDVQALALDIDYNKEKPVEIREFSRNGALTRYRDFAFDSKGVIVAFGKTAQSTQSGIVTFKHQFSFNNNNNFLNNVLITKNVNGAPVIVNNISFAGEAKDILAQRKDGNGTPVLSRKAIYDNAGNMTLLVSKNLPVGAPDTILFSNYDNHPNVMGVFDQLRGENDFLPPSKNNPGTIIIKRSDSPPSVQQFTYEYNQQGNPVKIISDRISLFLEYREL